MPSTCVDDGRRRRRRLLANDDAARTTAAPAAAPARKVSRPALLPLLMAFAVFCGHSGTGKTAICHHLAALAVFFLREHSSAALPMRDDATFLCHFCIIQKTSRAAARAVGRSFVCFHSMTMAAWQLAEPPVTTCDLLRSTTLSPE